MRRTVSLAMLVALLVAGCGGSDTAKPRATASPSPTGYSLDNVDETALKTYQDRAAAVFPGIGSIPIHDIAVASVRVCNLLTPTTSVDEVLTAADVLEFPRALTLGLMGIATAGVCPDKQDTFTSNATLQELLAGQSADAGSEPFVMTEDTLSAVLDEYEKALRAKPDHVREVSPFGFQTSIPQACKTAASGRPATELAAAAVAGGLSREEFLGTLALALVAACPDRGQQVGATFDGLTAREYLFGKPKAPAATGCSATAKSLGRQKTTLCLLKAWQAGSQSRAEKFAAHAVVVQLFEGEFVYGKPKPARDYVLDTCAYNDECALRYTGSDGCSVCSIRFSFGTDGRAKTVEGDVGD